MTILSIPFLGETVGWRRALAILIGFAGVLLVVRPGFRELTPGHLAAVGASICGAATVLALRALGPTEKRITLMGVVFVAAIVVNGAIMAFDFHCAGAARSAADAGCRALRRRRPTCS